MSAFTANTITGIACLVLLLKKILIIEGAHNCMVVLNGNKENTANCSNALPDHAIPQDLDENIQHLILSNNMIEKISETSFSKYSSLVSLEMQQVKNPSNPAGSLNIHKDAFLPFTNLQVLDLTETILPSDEIISWPSTIRNLTITGCNVSQFDATSMKLLRKFNASYNRLATFPKFDKFAPLYLIDLRNNSLTDMDIGDVAPFCNLSVFRVSFLDSPNGILSPSQFCRCSRLEFWLDKYTFFAYRLPCQKAANENVACPPMQRILEPFYLIRRQCIRRTVLDLSTSTKFVVGSIVVILTVVIFIAAAYAKPVVMPKVADTHPFEVQSTTPSTQDVTSTTAKT